LNPRRRWQRVSSCRTLVILIFAATVSGLVGCAALTVPPTPTNIPAIHWQAEQLIGAIRQRQEEFRSLRALARVDYAGPGGKSGFQEAILVQRPDRLRLETLSFLGAILIVTVNDQEIVGYQPREDLFVRGRPSKENLFRTIQIPLELDEITALLLGLPPVVPNAPARLEGNALVFSFGGRKRDEVAFESRTPVPTRWERFDGAGEILVSAQFADYVSTPAGLFPSKISVNAPFQGKKLEIRYEQPELNVSLQAGLFSQQKPANVKELPFDALGG
jgi:hypothetical protein